MSLPSSQVAIVVPNYQETLPPAEAFSLARLLELYGELPLHALIPEHQPGAGKPFPSQFTPVVFPFRSLLDYSRLLVDPRFYDRFQAFEYLLIYQLDAYLFSDQLARWCELGFDYVGAPIFEGYQPPDPRGKMRWVGNGGFSLRKVRTARTVLRSRRRFQTFSQALEEARGAGLRGFAALSQAAPKLRRSGNDVHARARAAYHEDMFWATEAHHFCPGYRLPSVNQALEFGFEYAPRYCYEVNRHRLPFGCHAWEKYDPKFWREFIPFPSPARR